MILEQKRLNSEPTVPTEIQLKSGHIFLLVFALITLQISLNLKFYQGAGEMAHG